MGHRKPVSIYCIGDTQIKPSVKNPLIAVGFDIIQTLPNIIVHLGDHWDLPSLSNYDLGKYSFLNKCYISDIEAGNQAMHEFWSIIGIGLGENPDWNPEFHFCLGNHENRRTKALDTAPSMYLEVLKRFEFDLEFWEVHEFLKPLKINGVNFVHYIPNDFTDKAISSAQQGLNKKHESFVCGHKQTLEYAEAVTLAGKRIQGLIIGACYYHDEKYKSAVANCHFRGCAVLRNVQNGMFEMEIRNLKSLANKFKV